MALTAEELLLQVPLRNGMEQDLFQPVRKLEFSPVTLPAGAPAQQHLKAWIFECEQLQQAIDERRKRTEKFDVWFAETCLSKRPPGMTSGGVLSPARRSEKR
ncbi:LADA_0F09560g1_1 [Lachancea dasiensis]|uniref:LADA_0F09560g1_1 n=1 Tax=Lachancea dasiensis TaxID=1072105 RepID=A0A1G4JL95_9SACH|nr:LADA_0F09560g1_1 [Lachancea dasiensis]